ncbi:ATP-binding protein [Lentilitoribacter sp. Alg239-R112]|uniref:ATP-binding protein n=1 Tax=Lentilitoribacter sp. Alg239-R112 TaxID=2305987 RepID=UPI0013A6D6AD|nr:ATP-binding protein [Lentilitoribacter sp. Alg239-R112]
MSKIIEAFKARTNQLSRDWLTGRSKDGQAPCALLHVVSSFIGWTVAASVLCLVLLLPHFSLPTSFALALTIAGVFMLATGIICQTGQIKVASAMVFVSVSALIMMLVLSTGGVSSLYLSLFVILPLEAKHIGKSRAAISTGLAVAGASIVAVIGLQYGDLVLVADISAHELSTLSSVLLVLVSYALVRSGLLSVEPSFDELQDILINEPTTKALSGEVKNTNRGVLDNIVGLVTFHSLNGDVQSVHGSEPDLICDRPNNMLGQGFLNQIHVSDRISYLSAIDKLRQGSASTKTLLRFEAKPSGDEQFRYIQVSFMGRFDVNGDLQDFYAQSQDMTSYISAMDKIESLENISHENEVNKTRFLAGVSHELRTPLNSIMGFSDVLLHEVIAPLPDERQREYVSLIRQSGEHLLNVVNTMLDMSKIQNGHYKLHCDEFDLQPLLERTKSMLDIQAKNKKVDLTCRIAKGLPDIYADNGALTQIIINLVGNAIKFTEEGGIVSVDAEMDGSNFVLRVSDTGIGIPEDKISQIGQPFMQVDSSLAREFEGTGLGLSLVKGLVELHNGKMLVASILGEGTKVTVCIPQTELERAPIPEIKNRMQGEAVSSSGAVYKGDEANVA